MNIKQTQGWVKTTSMKWSLICNESPKDTWKKDFEANKANANFLVESLAGTQFSIDNFPLV